jgi:hypothetical protein
MRCRSCCKAARSSSSVEHEINVKTVAADSDPFLPRHKEDVASKFQQKRLQMIRQGLLQKGCGNASASIRDALRLESHRSTFQYLRRTFIF